MRELDRMKRCHDKLLKQPVGRRCDSGKLVGGWMTITYYRCNTVKCTAVDCGTIQCIVVRYMGG